MNELFDQLGFKIFKEKIPTIADPDSWPALKENMGFNPMAVGFYSWKHPFLFELVYAGSKKDVPKMDQQEATSIQETIKELKIKKLEAKAKVQADSTDTEAAKAFKKAEKSIKFYTSLLMLYNLKAQ